MCVCVRVRVCACMCVCICMKGCELYVKEHAPFLALHSAYSCVSPMCAEAIVFNWSILLMKFI